VYLTPSQLTDQEAVKIDLEELPVFQENLDALVDGCLEDSPDEVLKDERR
jgi:hypothetical protein